MGKSNRVQRFFDNLKNHPKLSILIIIVMIFLSLIGFLQAIQWAISQYKSTYNPNLSIVFVNNIETTHSLIISPQWNNIDSLDFSEPIDFSIAIENEGKASANNVRLFLLYPSAVLKLDSVSQIKTLTGLIDQPRAGIQTLEINIPTIRSNDIPKLIRKNLKLQVRIRSYFGIPEINNDIIYLERVCFSYYDSDVREGVFEIKYLISYDENNEIQTGRLKIIIPEICYNNSQYRHPLTNDEEAKYLKKIFHYPISDKPLIINEKQIEAFVDNSFLKKKMCRIRGLESKESKWIEISEGIGQLIEIDSNLDGYVDYIFSGVLGHDSTYWQMVPPRPIQFIDFDYILDLREESLQSFFKKKFEDGN